MKRKSAQILLLVSLAIIIYLTLYPFNFTNLTKEIDLRLLFFQKNHHSLSDMFSNFLLFMPCGFFWFYASIKRKFIGNIALFVFVLPFSFLIEYLQQFLPGRDSSIIDVIFNTIGALTGYKLASLMNNIKKSSFKINFSLEELFSLFFAFYLLCEPFIISLDLGDLKQKLKTISFSLDPNNLFLPSFFLSYALRKKSFKELFIYWASLELIRIFIVSIIISPFKSILRFLTSLFLFSFLHSNKKLFNKKLFILTTFAVCYFLEAIAPFKFIFPAQIERTAFVPFKYFIDNVSFAAIFSLIKELLCFTFWGLLDGPFLWGIVLASVSEIAQLFVKGRYADPTTLILAVLGILFGRILKKEKL